MGYLRRLARFWIWLVLVAVGVYVAAANQERIALNLPPMIEQITVPAWVAFLGFFGAGAALASLYVGVDTFKKGREIRRLKSEMGDRRPVPGGSERLEMVTATGRPMTIDPHV